MGYYAVCSDGHRFAGYDAEGPRDAIFEHFPDRGGGPVRTTEPNRSDRYGLWYMGAIAVYSIFNKKLQDILDEGDITTLECKDEGDFVLGKDFEWVGNYRWWFGDPPEPCDDC